MLPSPKADIAFVSRITPNPSRPPVRILLQSKRRFVESHHASRSTRRKDASTPAPPKPPAPATSPRPRRSRTDAGESRVLPHGLWLGEKSDPGFPESSSQPHFPMFTEHYPRISFRTDLIGRSPRALHQPSPTGRSCRGSPAVFGLDLLELLFDPLFDVSKVVLKVAQPAEKMHPRRLRRSWGFLELFLDRVGHELTQRNPTFRRPGFGLAKNRIRDLQRRLHRPYIVPYLRELLLSDQLSHRPHLHLELLAHPYDLGLVVDHVRSNQDDQLGLRSRDATAP